MKRMSQIQSIRGMLRTCIVAILLICNLFQYGYGFEPCDICRAPNVVNNPSGKVNTLVLRLLGLGVIVTCGQLDIIGQKGFIPSQICLTLQSRATLRRSCACGEPETPVQSPTKAPQSPLPTIAPATLKPAPPPLDQPGGITKPTKPTTSKTMDKNTPTSKRRQK